MLQPLLAGTLLFCTLSGPVMAQSTPEEPRKVEPFGLYVFTLPRGTEAAEERMRAAAADVEEIVELSDWLVLAEERDAADIVLEVKAYALAEDATVHYVYAEVDVLGEKLVMVGADEHERASRKRAVSDLLEKLRDYCVENFQRL